MVRVPPGTLAHPCSHTVGVGTTRGWLVSYQHKLLQHSTAAQENREEVCPNLPLISVSLRRHPWQVGINNILIISIEKKLSKPVGIISSIFEHSSYFLVRKISKKATHQKNRVGMGCLFLWVFELLLCFHLAQQDCQTFPFMFWYFFVIWMQTVIAEAFKFFKNMLLNFFLKGVSVMFGLKFESWLMNPMLEWYYCCLFLASDTSLCCFKLFSVRKIIVPILIISLFLHTSLTVILLRVILLPFQTSWEDVTVDAFAINGAVCPQTVEVFSYWLALSLWFFCSFSSCNPDR